MSRVAKSVHTNGKWNATPIDQGTCLVKSNTLSSTKYHHTKNNQSCSNYSSSCKDAMWTQMKFPICSSDTKRIIEATKSRKFLPERYDITRRSLNQTVGSTMRAVKIPKKCKESSWKPDQLNDTPGNSLVRFSPSKVMNSTQYDCRQELR